MSPLARVVSACAFLVAVCAAAGCRTGHEAIPVASWTLVAADAQERTITLPAHLALPDTPLRYELRTTIRLGPELRGRDLGLLLPYFAGRAALRIGSDTAPRIDGLAAEGYRASGPQAFRIPASLTAGDELSLDLEIDHRWTQSAWIDSVPQLAPEPVVRSSVSVRHAFDEGGSIVALGALLVVGFTYFVIYVFDRRRRSHAWFALALVTTAYYPLFNLGWTQRYFGVYDVPIVGLALIVAAVAAIHFSHAEFGLGPILRGWWLLLAIAGVTAAFAHGPFNCTPVLANVVAGALVLAAGHEIWRLSALVRRRPTPVNARTLLLCWVLLSSVIWNDLMPWLGWGEPAAGVRLGSWGLAAFALLQSVALSRQHILAYRRAEELNVELARRIGLLEARQKEIQLLNDELRRQVVERSHDLAQVAERLADVAHSRVSLAVGDIVADRYRIVRPIGSGGMGSVYEVVRETDGARLAMKVLKGAPDRVALARFAREAEIVARIDHPNVIRIYDVGISAQNFLYLVMELVDGLPLSRRTGRDPVDVALEIVRQTSEGLAAIHEQRFVHRDIKPANLLLSNETAAPLRLKITDFGIAGLEPDGASRLDPRPGSQEMRPGGQRTLTRSGMVLGTPWYVAPELSCGMPATPAADVFALGLIAYDLLSGTRGFDEAPYLLAMRGAFRPPPSLLSVAPLLDRELATLLDRCLLEWPDARPTAAEIARALEVFVRGSGMSDR